MPVVSAGIGAELDNDTGSIALAAAGISLTVPAREIWLVERLVFDVTTSITVGSRTITGETRDVAGDSRHPIVSARPVAASLSETYRASMYDEPGTPQIEIDLDIPFVLFPGWIVFLDDTANVDATGDTGRIRVQGQRYSLPS